MINVLYIANDTGFGGATYSLLDMLEAVKEKVNPIVIIPSAGDVEEQLTRLHIAYYIVPFERDCGRIGKHSIEEAEHVFVSNYQAALKLQSIIQIKEIQIIHTNSSVSNVGVMAALIANIPHVWHVRELLEEDFDCEFLDKELKKELFTCTDKVISISSCVNKAYKRKYNIDSLRIYDGLNVEKHIGKDSNLKKKNCFLLAGVISPQKGQIDAIKAVNEIVRKGIDIQLYIVGSGNYQYRWILKRFIKECGLGSNVHILTFRENLRKLREWCLFSITSSKMEALGRVTIEAMLNRSIVLGADTGGTAEIIGEDLTRGYLYKQGNWMDLARVMQYAMENMEKNAEIQESAQAYALETFDLKRYGEKIIKIYEDELRNQRSCRFECKTELSNRLKSKYEKLKNMTAPMNPSDHYNVNKLNESQTILQRWLSIKHENISFAKILMNKGIYSVAIYGMGYLGCSLFDELEHDNIKIEYVMDRDIGYADNMLNIVRLVEKLPEVDVIIVTVLGDIANICNMIKANGSQRIISLSEVLNWCEEGAEL